ncbi:MAG: IPTL-CTERM sorting domain-containing protein [Candidatus Dadabacteria bacterium]|nr:IPTL-CTERM sorting domain-containing protein [Candidatus Dadabacteria bacterium]
MNRLFLVSVIAVATFFAYQQISFAVCVEGPTDTFTCNTNPPNPDPVGVQQLGNNADLTVNVLPGAGINTLGMPDTDAIKTSNGSDNITITGGDLRASDNGISTGNGGDNIMVEDSLISGICEAIRTGNDGDTITVINSTIISSGCEAVNLGNDDDTLTLGTGANIVGLIRCGNNFDTLIFTMAVPDEDLAFLSLKISSLNPAGDSIAINGLFYIWEDCELLVNEIVGGGFRMIRPIPTLSEWGLIAMAGILGIVGFMVLRRRKVTA